MCPKCFMFDRRVPKDPAGVCWDCLGITSRGFVTWPPKVAEWIAGLKKAEEHTLSDAEAELCAIDRRGIVRPEDTLVYAAAEALTEQAEARVAEVAGAPQAPPLLGSHYGTPGTRATQANVECTYCSESHLGEYGEWWLVKFKTPCGCELVWFASSSTFLPDAGTFHDMKFTVKEHSEYEGRKTTKIQRASKL